MAPRGPKPKQQHAIAPGPMPDPPDWMNSERALQLWHQYGPTLNKLGLLESLDAVGFSMLCDAIDDYLTARSQLIPEEFVINCGAKVYDEDGNVSYTGSPMQNPLVAIIRQHSKAIRELLVEYGMTPTGRVRLTGSTSVQPVEIKALDPLEELAKKMNGGLPPALPEPPVTPARRKKAAKKASKSRRR